MLQEIKQFTGNKALLREIKQFARNKAILTENKAPLQKLKHLTGITIFFAKTR